MINWFCFCNRQLKDRALLCKIDSVICTKIRWSEIIKNERRYFIYIKWLFTQQHLLYWPSSITKKDCSPNNTFCRASTMNYCIGSHAPKPSTHPALGTIATRLYAFNWPCSKDDCYFQLTQHQERMLPHQNLLLTHNNC